MVCGVVTNLCVETTVRSAFMRDMPVTLIEDCCAAKTRRLHELSIEVLSSYDIARIVSLGDGFDAGRPDVGRLPVQAARAEAVRPEAVLQETMRAEPVRAEPVRGEAVRPEGLRSEFVPPSPARHAQMAAAAG